MSLGDTGKTLYMLGMAEAGQFEGWRHVRANGRSTLTDASGSAVNFYPETIRFRITVSMRIKLLRSVPLYPVSAPSDVSHFLSGLRFQLKMLHGLEKTVFAPVQVEVVAEEEETFADERIYLLTFRLPQTPITDRCLVEVYSADGEHLARFNMDLM
ncbi:MAG: hypothetical protein AB7O65_12910 [Candidatus Korobacteraceae bacterium]